jgi:tRNA pseudouridine38-40 synthase
MCVRLLGRLIQVKPLNLALLLAYDGAAFRGWQKQPGMVTVQGALEDALEALTGKRLVLHGASRTDAGVHAHGQVANFRTARSDPSPDEKKKFFFLGAAADPPSPPGVRVLKWAVAADSFHARSSAIGKKYRYRLAAFVAKGDWERARAALRGLEGLTELSGLASPAKGHKPAPPLTNWSLDDEGTLLVEGRAFRKHEVRNIAGHLGAVALGYAAPESLRELAQRKRPWMGATAPADGLTLLEVLYPREIDPFR